MQLDEKYTSFIKKVISWMSWNRMEYTVSEVWNTRVGKKGFCIPKKSGNFVFYLILNLAEEVKN